MHSSLRIGGRNIKYKESLLVIGLLFIAHLSSNAGAQSIAAIAPLLRSELAISKTQIGFIISFFYIGAAVCSLPSGSLVDNWGIKKVLVWGQFIMGLAIALFAFMSNYYLLLLFFLLAGSGYSTINPASSKAVINRFPVHFRGMAMGAKQTGNTVGGALSASLLPLLAVVYGFGWRGAILACGIFLIFTTTLSYFLYPAEKEQKGDSNFRAKFGDKQQYIELFSNRKVLFICALAFFLGASQFSFISYLVIYFSENINLSITLAGTLLMLAQLGGTLGRLTWGVISDVFFGGRRKPVIIMITVISFLGNLTMAYLTPEMPYYFFMLIVTVLGFTVIGWNAVYMVWVGEVSGERNAGKAIGLIATFVFMGSIFGTPIFGAIVDLTSSFSAAYQTYAIMLGLLALIFIFMKE